VLTIGTGYSSTGVGSAVSR